MIRTPFNEKLHPRGQRGRWAETPDAPDAPKPAAKARYSAAKVSAGGALKGRPPAGVAKAKAKAPKEKKRRARTSDSLQIEPMAVNLSEHLDGAEPWMHETGAVWYPASQEWVAYAVQGTKFTPEQGAAIVAAFSPNTSWNDNLIYAANFIKGHKVSTLGDNIERAQRVADMVDVHGNPVTDPIEALPGKDPEKSLKITNFHRNITGDEQAVTVDRWAIRAALNIDAATAKKMLNQVGTYEKVAEAYRAAAAKAGISPAQAQAIIWGKVRGGFD